MGCPTCRGFPFDAVGINLTHLSFSLLVRFYVPLALSGLLMTLQQPLVAFALSRVTAPEESLSAYGLALSIAVFLESPVQMLLAAGAALVDDRISFRLLQRFTLAIGITLVGLEAGLAFTPLSRALFREVFSVQPPLSSHALLALRILLPWPLVVAWRRLYQGTLIHLGETRAVSFATTGRLVAIGVTAFLAISLTKWPGGMIGAFALLTGALVEALLVTLWYMLAGNRLEDIADESESLNLSHLWGFYWPLSLTSIMSTISWPVINAGISRAVDPEHSLAAWLVSLSLLWLFTTPLQMIQQTAISLGGDASSLDAVRRFALSIGVIASGILALAAFTPLLRTLMLEILNLPDEIVGLVVLTTRLMTILPFLTAVQSFYQGLLIKRRQTNGVRMAMGANLLVLVIVLMIGIQQDIVPGSLLAAAGMTIGLLTEACLLLWKVTHPHSPAFPVWAK